MTDQAPVSGGGWLPQEELSAGRMRADGGSLRMRRPLSRVPQHGWLLGFLPGATATMVVVVACWPLDMLGVGVSSDVEPDAHREGRLLRIARFRRGALNHIETAAR